MAQDVLPAVLAEHVVQPEQRQPEQGDPEQRGPRGDLANCVWKCQASYRSRAVRGRGTGRSASPQKLLGLRS